MTETSDIHDVNKRKAAAQRALDAAKLELDKIRIEEMNLRIAGVGLPLEIGDLCLALPTSDGTEHTEPLTLCVVSKRSNYWEGSDDSPAAVCIHVRSIFAQANKSDRIVKVSLGSTWQPGRGKIITLDEIIEDLPKLVANDD